MGEGLLVMHHTHHESRVRTHPVMPEFWKVFVSVSVIECFDSVAVVYWVRLGYRDSQPGDSLCLFWVG